MKNFLLVLIIYITLASCHTTPQILEMSTATFVPTRIPLVKTSTPKPSSTEFPSAQPTSTPLPFPQSFEFPDWMHNPDVPIMLIAVGDINEPDYRRSYDHLSLFNSGTSEHFDIYIDDISGYFWSPDGLNIGILNHDRTTFFLVDTLTGEISTQSIDKGLVYMKVEEHFPEALIAYIHEPGSFDYSLISKSMSVSSDGLYIALRGGEYGEDYTYVEDLLSDQSIMISEEGDHIADIDRTWIGNSHQIAIAHSDTPQVFEPSCFVPESGGDYWLSIYDGETGDLLARFDNITSAKISHDGQKVIYRSKTQIDYPWSDVPCIFDTIKGSKRCLEELLDLRSEGETFSNFEWVSGSDEISYLYFYVSQDPYAHHGGLCTFNIVSGQSVCFLEDFENKYEVPIRYEWSPGGEFVLFLTAMGSPCGDDSIDPRWGILDTESGDYFFIADMDRSGKGLWRSIMNQE